MKLSVIVHTIFSRILLIIASIIFAIPLCIVFCLAEKKRYEYRFPFYITYWYYWVILKCTLLPITFKGLENIPNKPVIFAANHQSSLDIPLLGVLAKTTPHIWLAKSELMESLLLRWILPLFSVLVDVSSPKKAMRSFLRLFSLINGKPRHLMIFPEGGRYTDGTIHDFFNGFALLAKKAARPVVPVYISGVQKVYPPETFFVYWHPITVIVGPLFVYQDNDTDDSFKQRVHDWFVQQVGV